MFDKKEYLKQLEDLVNIDSGQDCPEGISAVASYMEQLFEGIGWQTKTYDLSPNTGNCLAVANRWAEHYDIMFVGHIDTVFEKGTCAQRPFRIEGNKAFGPGVCDMKHGVLAIYHAIKNLPKEVSDNLNMVCVFNPDEEIGSPYSMPIFEEYGTKSKYCFVYETAQVGGDRCYIRKGSVTYNIGFHGKAGHVGFVFENGAYSAVHEMGRFITELADLQSEERGTSGNVIGGGGRLANVVADYAELTANFRVMSAAEVDRIDAKVKQLMENPKEPRVRFEILKSESTAPMEPTQQAHDYVKHAQQVAKEHGIDLKVKLRGGLSDANHISRMGAICLDGLAPEGADDHSPGEFMLIDTVEESIALSDVLIKDIAKAKTAK